MSQHKIRSNPQNAQTPRAKQPRSVSAGVSPDLKNGPALAAIRNPPEPNIEAHRRPAAAWAELISQIRRGGASVPLYPIHLFLRVLVSSWQEKTFHKCRACSTNRPFFCKTNPIPKTQNTTQTLAKQGITTKKPYGAPEKTNPIQTQFPSRQKIRNTQYAMRDTKLTPHTFSAYTEPTIGLQWSLQPDVIFPMVRQLKGFSKCTRTI